MKSKVGEMVAVIASVANSLTFNLITFRLGAYLLLFSNIFLPLGLHRPWMGIGGWWLFAGTFILSAAGSFQYLGTHVTVWQLLNLPYVLLLVFDAWAIAVTRVPQGGAGK